MIPIKWMGRCCVPWMTVLVACARVESAPSERPAPPAPVRATVGCAATWLGEVEALADRNPKAASLRLRQCLDEQRGPPSAYRLLASLQEDLGDARSALRTLSQAVALYPSDGYAWLGLARLHLLRGSGPEGLGALSRARELRPDDPIVDRAWRDARAEHGPELDRRLARLSPLLAELDGRYELGELPEARDLVQRLLTLAAGAPTLEARVRLRGAWVELAEGRLDATDAHVTAGLKAATEAPLIAELRVVASELALRRERWNEAVAHAEAARAAVPGHTLATVNLAVAEFGRGRRDIARARYLDALGMGIATEIEEGDFRSLLGIDAFAEEPPFEAAIQTAYAGSGPSAD